MFGKYYKTKLMGFSKDVTIDYDNQDDNIYFAPKIAFMDIIVKETPFGFREISTGTKIDSLRIDGPSSELDYGISVKIPKKPVFIIDDRGLYNENMTIATKEDITNYLVINNDKYSMKENLLQYSLISRFHMNEAIHKHDRVLNRKKS